MEVEFRKFRGTDKKMLTQMMLDFYDEVPSIKKVDEKNAKKTIIELERHPEKGMIFLFEIDETIVGYSIVIFFWSNEFGGDFVNVDELYVKPAFRDQGVATHFFKHLKQKFTKAVAIQLEVNPQNKKAQQFYQKIGFKAHENMVLDLEMGEN